MNNFDYLDSKMTSCDEEYWLKKNYLDNIEVNRRIVIAHNNQHIDDTLSQMYEELGRLETRLLVQNNLFATFKPELFPKELMAVVDHIASLAEFDQASVLLATLGSIASAMCGRYVVQLDEEWREPGCLFAVISAEPGSRKSAVMSKLGQPHDKYFGELTKEFEEQSAEFEENKKNLAFFKQKLTNTIITAHLKNSCADGFYSGDSMDLLSNLKHTIARLDQQTIASKPKYKTLPQIFLNSASKLSAAENMSRQGEFAFVFEAEGGFFENEIAFRSANPDLYTKSYDMESYYYASKNAGRIAMRRPAMCITAFIQPDVLLKLYKNNNLRARGLVPRFLVLFASKPVWIAQNRSLPAPPNAGAMIAYNTTINEMLKRNYTQDKNREIRMVSVTSEAYELIKAYELELKPFITSMQFLHMSSFLSKAHGASVRLALCIHAWNNPEPETCPITREEMQAAISLMELIIAHANIAFAPEQSQAYVDAQSILSWIYRCDWTANPVFTDRNAMTAISGLNKKQCHTALNLLEQHNYIRQYLKAGEDRICVLHPRPAKRNLPQRSSLIGRY